jgi:predicted TIM-barrel fold metal-dependent hydrolase
MAAWLQLASSPRLRDRIGLRFRNRDEMHANFRTTGSARSHWKRKMNNRSTKTQASRLSRRQAGRIPGSLALAGLLLASAIVAQSADDIPDVSFKDYDPPSTLVVPGNEVTRARYPFIDVHNHQRSLNEQSLETLVAEMDKLNMAVMVNLSGRGFRRVERADGSFEFGFQDGKYLAASAQMIAQYQPGKVVLFTNLDTSGIDDPDWSQQAVAQLERDYESGARGLKIYKSLGLSSTDSKGQRIAVDDPRIDPVWARCGELGIPVLIHTGEPAPFWSPRDKNNERLLELIEKPDRYRGGDPDLPSFEEVMAEQHAVFRRHKNTKFINAHLGWMGNDLGRLGKLLDEMPNVYTEIGAVLAELGRQPRFAREWLIRYQDRVMFGKDSWNPEEYHTYFRVLETADDYFPYYRRRHAFWRMYGLDLPDEVLKKLYYKNALEVIPGIDRSLFPE